jgi:hypothetical protein
MGLNTPYVILMMVALVCSIVPGLGALLPPAAFAQQEETSLGEEEEEEEENFARSIVSDVLGSDNNDNENGESNSEATDDESNQEVATNTAAEDSSQGQTVDQDDISTFGDDTADLEDANVAVPLGIPIDIQLEEVVEEEAPTPTPPEEEEPPEFVAFCYEFALGGLHCYDTLEECQVGNVLFEEGIGVDNPDCEGVETVPPGAGDCEVISDQAGEPVFAVCLPT